MSRLVLAKRIGFGPALLALLLLCLSSGQQGAYGQGDFGNEGAPVLLPAIVAHRPEAERPNAEFAPGQIAVGVLRDAASASAVQSEIEAQVVETIDMAGLDGADGDAGVDGYLLRVPAGEEWQTIELLLEDPAVAFAQPNWIVRAAVVENGDAAGEVPFEVNDPLYEDEQWYMQRIQASRAWALSGRVEPADTEALPIQVVVIDSGVNSTHTDLRANLSLAGFNYFDPTHPPDDDCGHGTHVAGLIAAGINNGRGIAGAAADVRVAAYKTLRWDADEEKCTGLVSSIVQAIQDATGNGADVINLSVELDQPWPPLEAAVNHARSQGVLVLGAAGNCAVTNCAVKYPASYPAVMAIAATGYYDGRAWYSPKGDALDLAAPGGDGAYGILSTWPADLVQRCEVGGIIDGDGYCEQSGTSMAAAVATGVAALAWSVRPEITAEDVRDILEETSRPLPYAGDEVGDGLVDAGGAVRYALRSGLDVSPRQIAYELPAGTPPFETMLLLENPSLEPVAWLITGTSGIRWMDALEPVSGTVRYGEPVRAPLVISATHVLSGSYRRPFTVEGERADGSTLVIPMAAALEVYAPVTGEQVHMPLLQKQTAGAPVWPYVEYRWERPDTVTPGAMGRVERVLLKDASIGITLPVTVTVGGQHFTDARIYSDGYVLIPASAELVGSSNRCLPSVAANALGAFGWWGDLDPGKTGGRISTFQAGPDRFVIEFENVYVEGGAPDERASFQMTLYAGGSVGMNYKLAPHAQGAPLPVTVGAQRREGRYYNQIVCVTPEIEVGMAPRSFQSILLKEEDLF